MTTKLNEKHEECDFLFKGNEMVSKDTFVYRGESYPIEYNCMPVDLESMRKLKQHLLDIGYNDISIIKMSVFGGNNFLVIAKKTKSSKVQVQSGLPEDLSFLDKLFRKIGLF